MESKSIAALGDKYGPLAVARELDDAIIIYHSMNWNWGLWGFSLLTEVLIG
ncbi:MAG: hypothetical protein Ct9H300mP28_15860 [Pseudomonadota bacterium]|nr:MAG: hypothetical protein Ct9H300mP28_15860 [Pseudomonadota bacterium]